MKVYLKDCFVAWLKRLFGLNKVFAFVALVGVERLLFFGVALGLFFTWFTDVCLFFTWFLRDFSLNNGLRSGLQWKINPWNISVKGWLFVLPIHTSPLPPSIKSSLPAGPYLPWFSEPNQNQHLKYLFRIATLST